LEAALYDGDKLLAKSQDLPTGEKLTTHPSPRQSCAIELWNLRSPKLYRR